MSKGKVTQNRKIQLAVFVLVILVIGGFVGSVITKAAMNREMNNTVEKLLASMNATVEKTVAKELKKQQTSDHEDESPPLKKKKQPTRKEFKEKLKKLVAKTGKAVAAKRSTLESGSAVTEETETSKTATSAAVSASESTDTSATATPATTTPGPTAVPKETAIPESTSEPLATSTAIPTQEPVATSTATPTQKPIVTEKPITVKVISDTIMYKDVWETEVIGEVKKGNKLTNVTEYDYGMLKVTYNGKEGFVDYLGTNYLDRKGIYSPTYEQKEENDLEATVCGEAVELRTRPGFTSKSEVVDIVEDGRMVKVLGWAEMLRHEDISFYKVKVIGTNKEGYIHGSALDFNITFKVSKDDESRQEQKEEDSKSTETSWETGLTIKVVRPMKMYEGDTTKSKVLLELEPDEDLFNVQETTESNSGMLMVKCKRGNKVIKGFVEYLNTNYLDQIKRYDSVYQKKLDNVKATVNANSVNLRNRPGITKKSKVVGVADKSFSLILVAYEEVVRYEKHGWFKAIVNGQLVYIYGEFVDVDIKEVKKQEEKETTEMQEEGKAATGSAITANEEDDDQTKTENETIGSAITASKDDNDQTETEKTTSQEYKSESVPKDSKPVKRQTDIYLDKKYLQRIMKIMQRKGRM